jgi:hypothetical protein
MLILTPANSSCKCFPINETKEAVINGRRNDNVFNIVANDVTIDSLMIKNTNSDTIESKNNIEVKNASIHDNIITQSKDEGIQLHDCKSCVVEFNHIFDTDHDGANQHVLWLQPPRALLSPTKSLEAQMQPSTFTVIWA